MQLSEIRSESLHSVSIEGLSIRVILVDRKTLEFIYSTKAELFTALSEWAAHRQGEGLVPSP